MVRQPRRCLVSFSALAMRGGDPCEIGISYPDPNAGVFGALAVMAALTHRAKTGEGQFIDQSQWETVLVQMVERLLEYSMTSKEPVRRGNHDILMAPHDCYKAAGNSEQWVSIAVGRRIHAGIPWKISASPCSVSKAAPLLGQGHQGGSQILLKLSDEQIQELRRRETTV